MTKQEIKTVIDSLTMEYEIVGVYYGTPYKGKKRLVEPEIIKVFIDLMEGAHLQTYEKAQKDIADLHAELAAATTEIEWVRRRNKMQKLQLLLETHRKDAVVTCHEDCWCWELEQLEAENEQLKKELADMTKERDDAFAEMVSSAPPYYHKWLESQQELDSYKDGSLAESLRIECGMLRDEIFRLENHAPTFAELDNTLDELSRCQKELAEAQAGELAALARVDALMAELKIAIEKCVELQELVSKSQGMASEINLLTKENRELIKELIKYKAFWEQSRLADQMTFLMYVWKEKP